MAKITAEQGEAYKEWDALADKFAWSIVYVETGTDKSEPHAMLKTTTGRVEKIGLATRQAYERSQSNVAPIRSEAG